MEQDSVAVKHMEDKVGYLERFSDDGRYMRQPGLSSGSCYELAVELGSFIDLYKQKKWKGLADAKGVLDFGSELVTPEFGRGALWAEQKLKEKNEGTIR